MSPLVDWGDILSFQDYGELVSLLANSIVAGAVLGIVGGLIGVFVMQRDLAFAVHGVSELSFAGAAAALLFGGSVVAGSLGGALVVSVPGVLLLRRRRHRSIVVHICGLVAIAVLVAGEKLAPARPIALIVVIASIALTLP